MEAKGAALEATLQVIMLRQYLEAQVRWVGSVEKCRGPGHANPTNPNYLVTPTNPTHYN